MRGQVGHSKVLGPPLQWGTLLGVLLIDINFQVTAKQLVFQLWIFLHSENMAVQVQNNKLMQKSDAVFSPYVTGQLNAFWGLSCFHCISSGFSVYAFRQAAQITVRHLHFPPVFLVLIGILDECWIIPFHLPIDFSLGQTPPFWFVKC